LNCCEVILKPLTREKLEAFLILKNG